jgi:DNA modification methylase
MIKTDVIYKEDWRVGLRKLPDECIDCCITSPPYFSKRDYGVDGQFGLEESPELYLEIMVDGCMEIKRVLKPHGTFWLNIGDTYWGGKGRHGQESYESAIRRLGNKRAKDNPDKKHLKMDIRPVDRTHSYIKSKDLIGIPWLVAMALRDGKANLKECIAVYKTIDRIMKAYGDEIIPYRVQREILKIRDEYSYKTKQGFYLRNDIIWNKRNPHPESAKDRCTMSHEYVFLFSKIKKGYYFDYKSIMELASENTHPRTSKKNIEAFRRGDNIIIPGKKLAGPGSGIKSNVSFAASTIDTVEKRMKRDVWTTSTNHGNSDHIAHFGEDLIAPMIIAGCPEGGIVLDPFMGRGTTAVVSRKLKRHYIGYELSPESIEEQKRYFFNEFSLFQT